MENKVYNWFVKKGNIIIQNNGDLISLQLEYENWDCCLLTCSDTLEIMELLTDISKQVWERPDYERTPYTKQLFRTNQNEYIWEIDQSQLLLKYNEMENGVEIKYNGGNKLNLEINCMVEIIQVLKHLNS